VQEAKEGDLLKLITMVTAHTRAWVSGVGMWDLGDTTRHQEGWMVIVKLVHLLDLNRALKEGAGWPAPCAG
jgi:hypothetical protein